MKLTVIHKILQREGSYVNHPADAGRATNWGITEGNWPHGDVRDITREEAIGFYSGMWDSEGVGDLPLWVQDVFFDTLVHSGKSRAVKILQKTVNALTDAGLQVDGGCGLLTKAALAKACHTYGHTFSNAYVDQRLRFLANLVASKPSQVVFLRGWVARCLDLKMYLQRGEDDE